MPDSRLDSYLLILNFQSKPSPPSLYCRRLLSTDPEAAKEVVLAEKPVIADTTSNLEPALLDLLLQQLSTLASVYHKPPEVGC